MPSSPVLDPPGTRERIAVADRSPIFARAAADLIGDDPDLGGSATILDIDAEETAILDAAPDLVILDPAQMPRLAALTETLRKGDRPARMVACASNPSVELARFCIEMDFRGFVPKTVQPSTFVRAVKVVASGGSFIDKVYGRHLLLGQGSDNRRQLSSREEDVIRAISRGDTNREISEALGISTKTVDTHRARAMSKLALADRRALLRLANARGWLD